MDFLLVLSDRKDDRNDTGKLHRQCALNSAFKLRNVDVFVKQSCQIRVYPPPLLRISILRHCTPQFLYMEEFGIKLCNSVFEYVLVLFRVLFPQWRRFVCWTACGPHRAAKSPSSFCTRNSPGTRSMCTGKLSILSGATPCSHVPWTVAATFCTSTFARARPSGWPWSPSRGSPTLFPGISTQCARRCWISIAHSLESVLCTHRTRMRRISPKRCGWWRRKSKWKTWRLVAGVDWLIAWSMLIKSGDQSSDWLIDWLMLIVSVHRSSDWLIDWLALCRLNHMFALAHGVFQFPHFFILKSPLLPCQGGYDRGVVQWKGPFRPQHGQR